VVHQTRITADTPVALLLILVGTCVPCAAGATTNGSAPLPYQAPNKHMGVATCASSVCHGSVTPSGGHDVRLDEFVTWSHQDKHSQAYNALASEKGHSIAAKLGLADARTAQVCLDCHSDNVPAAQRGKDFTVSDGVSCEACHGGAGPWLTSHSSRDASYRANVANGMYPTADLRERAALCLSCHYGNEDKFATHRIMGAGHPRLSFELDTFLALQPPHYRLDEGYQKRKPSYPRAQVWAYGQLAAAQQQMQLLQGPLVQASFVPELALLDCHSCHENPLHRSDWSRGLLSSLMQPGSIPFPEGHLKMVLVIARRIDESAATAILSLSRTLQKTAGESRESVTAASAQLGRALARLAEAAQRHRWARADTTRMLVDIVAAGSEGDYRDYISAEQAVMAIELLMIDAGVADRYRHDLDELYRLLRDDDAYTPTQLRDTLRHLRASLPADL
jgi:hypothetical protein